ncbi:MAG: hypothetical protein AAB442_01765 [Patescibacteria group bacterium]
MYSLVILFVFLQALGAFTGAFATIWAELAYIRAMRDGKVDRAERTHLDAIATGLRFGMTLILLASLGLVILAYVSDPGVQPGFSQSYWTLMLLSLLIVWVSWALSRKRVSFAYGSAIAFSAWWFLAYATLGWLPLLSFGAVLASFVVVTGIFFVLLQLLRTISLRSRK